MLDGDPFDVDDGFVLSVDIMDIKRAVLESFFSFVPRKVFQKRCFNVHNVHESMDQAQKSRRISLFFGILELTGKPVPEYKEMTESVEESRSNPTPHRYS